MNFIGVAGGCGRNGLFGLLLESWDWYAVPWAAFAALSALVMVTMLLAGAAIDRERGRSAFS